MAPRSRPPYLAFQLDARKKVAVMCRGPNVHPGIVAWALMDLWEHVRTTKNDMVGAVVVSACFAGVPDAIEHLVAFEFLEDLGEGQYRVRGAEDLLGVASTVGGTVRAAGAARDQRGRFAGSSPSSDSPATVQRPSSGPPATVQQLPAPPNTKHQTPTLSPGPVPTSDLLEGLAAVYAERHNRRPRWGVAEARALEPVLVDGPDEVLRRWRIAMWWQGWPTCRTVKDLIQHWDRYVAPQEQRTTGPPRNTVRADPNAGIIRSNETRPCEVCGADADNGVIWDRWLCTVHQGACWADVPAAEFNATTVAAWIQKRREAA